MAYTLRLGTFAKKENSTAQPDVTGWAEFSIVLKHGSDLINPEVTLTASESDVINYNYAYLFGNYYWIIDKTMDRNNLCTLTLKKDVLASYKTAIGQTNMYILRSSAASNGNISDGLYAPTASVQRNRQVQAIDTIPTFSNGVIVVNILGSKANTGSNLIQFTPQNFVAFVNKLYTTINGFQLSDIVNKITQFFGGNPADLIGGAMWFPYPFEVDALEYIKIGGWDSEIAGGVVSSLVIEQTIPEYSYTLPKHPQVSRGAYLNLSPYTRYTLGVPCGGVVELDTTQLVDQTSITISRKMEAGSGNSITRVIANPSGRIVAYLSGQMGIPININGSNNGAAIVSGTIGTVGAAAAAIATGGASAIIGAASAGISTVVNAMSGTAGSANVGAATVIGESGWLDTTFNLITDEDNANNGRPYCQVSTPATLGGYMIANNPPLSISATYNERQEIEQYLTSGFYYE